MKRGFVEKTVWWIVFFLYVGSGYSQRIVNSTETSVAISFDLPSYTLVTSEISEIIADYYPGEYKTVLVSDEDYGQVADPGFPAVPQLTFYVRIPFNAVNVQVSMENAQVESRSLPVGVYIEPYVDYGADGVEGDFLEVNYYQNAATPYTLPFYELSEPFEVMGEKAVSLTVIPFQYLPRTGVIQILEQAEFQLSWSLSGAVKADVKVSPARKSFLSEELLNYNPPKENVSDKLLIVTAPIYESGLSLFSQYKQNIGMDVQTVSTDVIGKTVENIRNYVEDVNPDYVLLVGSVNDIPYTSGNPSSEDMDNPITDQEYRRWSGNDKIYGDVYLGRWPVTSTQELAFIINKTIKTECEIGLWPKRAVFLAGFDDRDHMENAFRKGHDKAIQKGFSTEDFRCDKYYQSPYTSIDALKNNYPFWFVYSGHGSLTSLAYGNGSSFRYSDWKSENVYPFVFSFACKTGNYSNPAYLACAPTKAHVGPSIYFGSSVNTLKNSDLAIEEKVLGSSFGEQTIGAIVTHGMTKYRKRLWSRMALKRTRRYMKSYNLIGDPSLLKNGLPSMVNDYIFSQKLEAVSGIDLMYEASRTMIINQGVSLSSNAALLFRAGTSMTVSGNIAGTFSSLLKLEAKQVFLTNAKVEAGTNMEVKANETIVLQPGTEISAGSNIILKVE